MSQITSNHVDIYVAPRICYNGPMTRNEERFLVEQAQADPRKFDALYRAYIDAIYRFVFYKTSQKETAEDITAQVFMQALERLSQFRYQPGARFSSWLYTIAHHQIVDYYRKRRDTVDLEQAEPIPSAETATDSVDSHLQQDRVRSIVQQLPSADQEVLQLRLWEDKSYHEIAQILHSNMVAIRARYSRALKKFNTLYTKRYGTSD